jgi:hypothetical protein
VLTLFKGLREQTELCSPRVIAAMSVLLRTLAQAGMISWAAAEHLEKHHNYSIITVPSEKKLKT